MGEPRKSLMSVLKVKINEIKKQITNTENISFVEDFSLNALAGYYQDNLETLEELEDEDNDREAKK
jgi:hypothetical protein